MGNLSSTEFDPYEILGIDRDANIEEIKLAYKNKARALHPDRNRGNEEKEAQFKLVTLAFEILSDPGKRSEYDESFAPTHNEMRSSARSEMQDVDQSKSRYGFGQQFEQNKFNTEFEKRRTRDPNDRGYGESMTDRLNNDGVRVKYKLEKGKNGRMVKVPVIGRQDAIKDPTRLFEQGQFDPRTFNQLFDHYKKQASNETAILEKSDVEPVGFSLMSGTNYTNISTYNGAMIVGDDLDDFSKGFGTTGLDYTDYEKGFSGFGKNPNKVDHDLISTLNSSEYIDRDASISEGEFNKLMADMRSDRSKSLVQEISSDNNRKTAFVEAERRLLEQRAAEIKKQKKTQKRIVLKYKDQFPQHLLDDLGVNRNSRTNNKGAATVSDRGNRSYTDLLRERSEVEPHTPTSSSNVQDSRQNRSLNDFMRERSMNMRSFTPLPTPVDFNVQSPRHHIRQNIVPPGGRQGPDRPQSDRVNNRGMPGIPRDNFARHFG